MKNLFIVSLILIFCVNCNNDPKTTKITITEPPKKTYPNVEDIVSGLKDKLTALDIDIDPYSRVAHTKKPAYVISVFFKKATILPFRKEEYYFQDGSLNLSGGEIKELLDNIGVIIDSTHKSNEKMFDILRGSTLTLEAGKAPFSASTEINIGDYFAEIGIILKRLYYSKYKSLKVYVQGAADVSSKVWDREQNPKYGIFKSIFVHPAVSSKTNFRQAFEDKLVKRYIDSTYYNKDLPNLRGAYVEDVLKQMLSSYKIPFEKYSVEILDGAEVGEIADEKFRRAEIIIELYD